LALLEAKSDAVPVRSERRDEFAEVFEELAPAVVYFFARRGFSPEDSRDLMQETFLKAYRGLSGFRDDAKFKTWLLRIAANVWKNALRDMQAGKRSAMKTVAFEDLGSDPAEPADELPARPGSSFAASPLDRAIRNERSRMLREAFEELPPRMRRCVQLRIDGGLKYREIASILSVSVDTVKTQLHQARRRLKDELDDYLTVSDEDE
jgi:RNA polymerase sigma-70 factor (ECF subfamily)